jgi:tetratricopeptide (TPR) repeat protein
LDGAADQDRLEAAKALEAAGEREAALAQYARLADDGDLEARYHQARLLVHQLGRPAEALPHLEAVIKGADGQLLTDAMRALAWAFRRLGQHQTAEHWFMAVVGRRSDDMESWFMLGNCLRDLDRKGEAEGAYRKALELKPSQPEALANLGMLIAGQDRHAEAIALFLKALETRPGMVEALTSLAGSYSKTGRMDEAVATQLKVVADHPGDAVAWCNLAVMYCDAYRFPEAINSCAKALELNPDSPEAFNHLGAAVKSMGNLDVAARAYGRAAQCGHPEGTWNQALVLLLMGRMAEGWQAYETRIGGKVRIPTNDCPQWRGEPLAGKRVLITGEQGRGDEIQFARYAARLAALGASIDISTRPELVEIFRTLPGIGQVMAGLPTGGGHDYWLSTMSAPHWLGTPDDRAGDLVPYLAADAAKTAYWRRIIRGIAGGKPTVGLCWQGNKLNPNLARSMTFETLAPILAQDRFAFFAVDREQPAIPGYQTHPNVFSLGGHLGDFTDSAAILSNLDLLITVDTAVAHLAGALGRPVWTMIQIIPDWRWLFEGDTTPWYPHMRLFRQTAHGDWGPAVAQVAQALAGLSSL